MKYRKSNRAKHVSSGCKNNGPCKTCEANRLYAVNRLEPTREESRAIKRGDDGDA